MKIKIGLVLIAMIFLALSCKKDKSIVQPIPSAKTTNSSSTSYLKLKTGNYWIYDMYNHDTLNGDVFANDHDSAYIFKDSLINGRTCYLLKNTNTSNLSIPKGWIVDSASFILQVSLGSASTSILLDPVHLNDTINVKQAVSGSGDSYTLYTLSNSFTNITVPAGVFSGQFNDVRIKYITSAKTFYRDFENVRYATGIGICYIYSAMYISDIYTGNATVWKLARYNAQ